MSQTLRKELPYSLVTHLLTVLSGEGQRDPAARPVPGVQGRGFSARENLRRFDTRN